MHFLYVFLQAVAEVNNYVAQFRDLLIHIGQSRDGPEMREKIRRMRRLCLESCRHAVHLLLQQIRRYIKSLFKPFLQYCIEN